jgi:hypothetical protein
MRTDDLITMLAMDETPARPFRARLARALALGVALSALLFLATIGIRPDLATVLGTPRVLFKIGFTLLLALSAGTVAFRIGVPGQPSRAGLLALPALALVLGVGAEIAALPTGAWPARLVGDHAPFCLFFIPVLSLLPLAGLFWAYREAAPAHPGRAGAVLGLAAAGAAAALYAWHCPDDSPLFVATWYGIAVALVTGAGALLGRRLLRW